MKGAEIARLRIDAGLSQTALADILGVRQPVISALEHGAKISTRMEAKLRRWRESLRVQPPAAPETRRYLTPQQETRPPPNLRFEKWGRPEYSGDFALLLPVGANGHLLAVVDVAGHGETVFPGRTFVEGWLRAYTRRFPGIPRLSELVESLSAELREAQFEISAFFAVIAPVAGKPHTVSYEAGSFGMAAPLLLSGPPYRTRTSTLVSPALPVKMEDIQVIIHNSLDAPWRLVVASDGLLQRLGGNEEGDGIRQLRNWFSGLRSRFPLEELLATDAPWTDDEVCASLEYGGWDFAYTVSSDDFEDFQRMLHFIRQRATSIFGHERTEGLCAAVLEALQNSRIHAYPGQKWPGRVSLMFRVELTGCRAEIWDEGTGTASQSIVDESPNGFAVMRKFCDDVFVVRNHPQGTGVILILDKPIAIPQFSKHSTP